MTALDEPLALPVAGPVAERRRGKRLPISLAIGLAVAWLGLLALLYVLRDAVAAAPDALDPTRRLAAPFSAGHPLGTDQLGRDLFARLIHGAPYSLAFGIVPTVVATFIGGALGLLAGYGGRILNTAIMRFMDILYAFPPILIALAIIGIMGSGFANCLVALILVLIPPVTRVTESATVRVAGLPFVEAARLAGASAPRIVLVQVLPNVVPPVLAYVTSIVGIMIIYGAGLSFLGLGVATPTPEWGLMLNDLRTAMFSSPATAATPGLFILFTSLSFSALGSALEARWALPRRA
jgi:peptide/nickel transport system permease protein